MLGSWPCGISRKNHLILNSTTQNTVNTCSVSIRETELVLLPENAIFVPAWNTLLLADIHFGKVNHFRRNGIGIPNKAAEHDYNLLANLLESINPQKVIILGDLFHSKGNMDLFRLNEFLIQHPHIQFQLVPGNHDKAGLKQMASMAIEILPNCYNINGFLLCHDASEVDPYQTNYILSGHVHPAFTIAGKGRQFLKLPCFYFTPKMGILPAFGNFKGSYEMEVSEATRIFVSTGTQVFLAK